MREILDHQYAIFFPCLIWLAVITICTFALWIRSRMKG